MPPSRLKHGFESRWGHHGLCIDDPGDKSAQRTSPSELVITPQLILAGPEDKAIEEQGPKQLPGLVDVPTQDVDTILEEAPEITLKPVKIDVGDPALPLEQL